MTLIRWKPATALRGRSGTFDELSGAPARRPAEGVVEPAVEVIVKMELPGVKVVLPLAPRILARTEPAR